MSSSKYTLVINNPGLSAGGVETGLVSLMRHFMNKGHRVIWITTTRHMRSVAFSGILDNPQVEIVVCEKWNRYFGLPKIQFQEDEHVIMLTCEATSYLIAEGLKRRAKTNSFKHCLCIAHFTGNTYYPDRYFRNKLLQKWVYRFYRRVIRRAVQNESLLGFSQKHLEGYETYYRIPIENKENRLFCSCKSQEVFFDLDNLQRRCSERNDRFVITTCSRFEFPHKGYILGLIDAFCSIHEKFPQTMLRIIGYGAGTDRVKTKISALPEAVRQKIQLVGMVSPDELEGYYKDSHLIVGLAGAIGKGAESGIPSLVVRHYCNDCETYGYYAEAHDKTLSETAGQNIIPFVEDCITMDENAYILHGKAGVECRAQKKRKSNRPRFAQIVFDDAPTVKWPWEALFSRVLCICAVFLRRLKR